MARSASIAVALMLGFGCGGTAPAADGGPTMPSHQAVAAAVDKTGDVELEAWVASADSYVLQPTEITIPGHTVWRVTPVEVSHPMSFFLVERARDGQLIVTSGNAAGLGQVVAEAPEAFVGEGGARLLVQLLADSAGAYKLVERPEQVVGLTIAQQASVEPSRVWADDAGVHALLFVVDDIDRLRRLDLEIPKAGAATLKAANVATSVELQP